MGVLTETSQAGLLAQSLELAEALLRQSQPKLWDPAVRLALHDELFRYFLALPHSAAGPAFDAPRLALEACLSPQSAYARSPSKKSPLFRPVWLAGAEPARAQLRSLVALSSVQAALIKSFGSTLINGSFGAGAKSVDSAAVTLAALSSQRLSGSAPPTRSVPSNLSGGPDFIVSQQVADQVEVLLGQCLPFSRWGVSMPSPYAARFSALDRLDAWLLDGLRPSGELWTDQANLPLYLWGLAFSLTARAYLADLLVSLVRVSLPLDRLYEETRAGAKTNLSLDSDAKGGFPVLTKRGYSAYTAVGLVELLTETPIAHLDDPPGPGYLKASLRLSSLGALDPFDKFWKSPSGSTHASAVKQLSAWSSAPVLRFKYDPGRGVKDRVPLAALSLDDLQRRMLAHALPAVRAPSSPEPASKQPQAKKLKAKPPKVDDRPFKQCGHFVTHLKLEAARQLAELLAQLAKGTGDPLPKNGSAYIRVNAGSLRWGGNFAPHFEHRDGFTYDVSNPTPYRPWPTGDMTESPLAAAQANRKNPKSVGKVLGVPDSQSNYLPLADPDKTTRDRGLSEAFGPLVAALLDGVTDGVGSKLNAFAGTPIFIGNSEEDSNADDGPLATAVVGHVALALAGVRKWVYASYYEHFFALRALGVLLKHDRWTQSVKQRTTDALKALMGKAEFYWAPNDHHDHWHVVFAKDQSRGESSLGPDQFTVDPHELAVLLEAWSALGVDLSGFSRNLAERKLATESLFPAAVAERKALLEVMAPWLLPKPSSDEARKKAERLKAERQARATVLAQAIDTSSYEDIPSLKGKQFQEWVRGSALAKAHPAPAGVPPKSWVFWPSDVEEPELKPDSPESGDAIDDPGL